MPRFADALDEEIADLEKQLEADPKFLKLRELRRLRELYDRQISDVPGREVGKVARSASKKYSGKSLEALNIAARLLTNQTKPVPTLEILRHLEEAGITFDGSMPQNTLSSILSKSPDFKANGRAGWTLAKEKADDDAVG